MAQFDLDSSDGTQAISAVSLPLPNGASTSDGQSNGTQQTKLRGNTDGTLIGNVGDRLKTYAYTEINPVSGSVSFYKTLENSGSETMVVNGTLGSPITFSQQPAGSEVWYLSNLNLFIHNNGTPDPDKFAAKAGGLTNGLIIRATVSSVNYDMAKIKNNMHIGTCFGEFPQLIPTTAGWYNNTDTYAGLWSFKNPLRLAVGDSINAIVQDNLTTINNFKIGIRYYRIIS